MAGDPAAAGDDAEGMAAGWLAVGRAEQVPEPGDFATVDVGDEPMVIVRGVDGEVRVFSRVCRHRYADVLADVMGAVPATGRLERFTCPYHMWTYRLDGSLINAMDFARRREFDPGRYGLHPFPAQLSEDGVVYVNLTAETDAETEAETDAETDADAETGSETDAETGSETESETGTGSGGSDVGATTVAASMAARPGGQP
jgi:phenylpropionate dioxygenase-like ring-hydroxylating dioxygenase large terminal subunit